MSLLKQDAGACRRETLRGLGLSGFPGTGSTLAGGCKGLRQPRASSQRPGPERGTGGGHQSVMLSSYSDSSSRTVQPPSRPMLCSRKRSHGRWSRTCSMAGS